jgi:hypothetical protein
MLSTVAQVMYADVNPTGARRGLTCVKSGELVETLMLCDHPLEHAQRTRALYVDACAVCGASDHTAKQYVRGLTLHLVRGMDGFCALLQLRVVWE